MQTVVGVLRGGPSREHEVSLKTGAAMIAGLPASRFSARDIYIDKQGVWHDRGRPSTPDRILRQVDVVLNGLHGEYGEDGGVQRLLNQFSVRYSGPDHLGAHLSMHKMLAKARAEELGIKTPEYILIESREGIDGAVVNAVRTFHPPVVVKPVDWGSSVGVSIVGGHAPIHAAVTELFDAGATGVLIEEYVQGREASVGVVEGLRGEKLYALPVIEVTPPAGDFYSYAAKYESDATRYACPGVFPRSQADEMQHVARAMHDALGLRHYSRSDFIVSPRGVYYLETNSLPGLSAKSHIPMELAAIGVKLPEFLTHLVNLTLSG